MDRQVEFEVSEVLDSKWDRHFRGKNTLRYLVHWAGYEGTDEETTWIAADDLEHALELTSLFHQHYLHKPGP